MLGEPSVADAREVAKEGVGRPSASLRTPERPRRNPTDRPRRHELGDNVQSLSEHDDERSVTGDGMPESAASSIGYESAPRVAEGHPSIDILRTK
jgi:hypothetical protein